jgi:hypothetical protein
MHKLLKYRPRADKVESRVFYPLPLTSLFCVCCQKKPSTYGKTTSLDKKVCPLAGIGGLQFDNAIFFDRRCAFQRVAVY